MPTEVCNDPAVVITPPGGDVPDCDCERIWQTLGAKQDKLIAGTNITISGSVISATGGGGGGTAGVTRFNGRQGNVVPQSGDYSASMIRAGDGKTIQQYVDEYNANKPDTVMSNTSTKAVQNNVIKRYVDAVDAKTLPPGGNANDVLTKIDGTNYNATWTPQSYFMMKAQYDPDNDGKVNASDKSDALTSGLYSVTAPPVNANTTVLVESQKGVVNGVVPLDSNRKILPEYLPDNIMSGLTYGGIFNAATRVVQLTPAAKSILGVTSDTMILQNSSVVPEGYPANSPLFYVTTNPGNFAGLDYANGDWLISLETSWQRLQNGSQVSSVNGMTGAVNLTTNQVPEGSNNLYYPLADKTKLAGIENQATRDVDVIQTASVTTLADGTRVLRLTNKNGTVTTFQGNSAGDDYLTKTGNASSTYVIYTPTGERKSFTGNELLGEFARNVVDWLRALETVAFTGNYNDLTNKPTKTSQFTNDGDGTNPFITRNTASLLNYYLKTETYTKAEVDALMSAIGSQNFIVVNSLPVSDIDTGAIYYVPVDPADPTKGYNRYQYIQGRWIFLGTTDVSLANYLKVDGNASATTSNVGVYTERLYLTGGETLNAHFGKINKWLSDLKTIAFTASWQDLEDADELALLEDLENYVPKQWTLEDAGKSLVIGNDGMVTLQSVGDTVVRRDTGVMSVVGNDHPDNKINAAAGAYSTAFGNNTVAIADNQFVRGKFNERDTARAYLDIVGNGTDNDNRRNAYTLNTQGHGNFYSGASAGNTTTNVWTPTQSNDFTTKKYVDEAIAESGNLKKQIVSEVPDVDDAQENVLYLIQDPDDPEVYAQWTKVLISTVPEVYEMAQVGSTRVNLDDYQLKEPGDLDTTSESVSGAINELLGYIGDISDLETPVKTDIVSALNSILATGDVIYKTLVAGENVRDYADGTKGAYVLSVPAGINGNPSTTASTIVSIPTDDKNYYYQFAMSGNVDVYFRRQPKAYAAEIVWNQMAVESIQKTSLPTASVDYAGKMYQYVGNKTSTRDPGKFYTCKEVAYYAWLGQSDSLTYFTRSTTPVEWDEILNSSKVPISSRVASLSSNTLTDKASKRYTRNSQNDTTQYEWVAATEVTTKQDLLDMIYPVGSIYIGTHSTNPHIFLGGTWQIIGTNRVLWGVAESTGAGGTLSEQLPNIYGNVDWNDGAQGKLEVTYESGALRKSDYGQKNYPQPSGVSSGYHGIKFDASQYNSVYTSNGIVRPNAYTVHFWRRIS